MTAGRNPEWRFASVHELLLACVGRTFGDNPENRLDDIRENRAQTAKAVQSLLYLHRDQAVADIGSGCGFVARVLAPLVRHLTCIDISVDFLQFCREELAEFSNISYCLSGYADFTGVESGSLHACYATAVCIHFNYYDFCYYLREVNRVLDNGGRFLFDFLNADRLDPLSDRNFSGHLSGYREGREQLIFNFMHPISARTIENLAARFGFAVVRFEFVRGFPTTWAMLQKQGPAPAFGIGTAAKSENGVKA